MMSDGDSSAIDLNMTASVGLTIIMPLKVINSSNCSTNVLALSGGAKSISIGNA